MDSFGLVSFKVFLSFENEVVNEVRRFAISEVHANSFNEVSQKIKEVFPSISNKKFSVFWKDEDNDDITISSDMELIMALTEMKSDVKKLYVKVNGSSNDSNDSEGILHPMVVCDACDKKIKGIRYKCITCRDYDLCSSCEKLNAHPDHPMLRISHPLMFDRSAIHKLSKVLSSFVSHKLFDGKHQCHHSKKRHCSDHTSSHSERKKKCQGSPNDSDSNEESCKKQGKKKRINSMDICKHLLSEYIHYFNPVYFEMESSKQNNDQNDTVKNSPDESSDIKYLQNIGKTISSLLDPLGIDVDIEVRSSTKGGEKEKPNANVTKNEEPSTSEKGEKNVHFDTPEKKMENLDGNIEKITSILANSKMTDSSEKDDEWVSYEQLKEDAKENSPSRYTGAIPKNSFEQAIIMTGKNEKEKSESSDSTNQKPNSNLYPDLNQEQRQLKPHIHQALGKMLEMGFTNEGGWLTQLLEAKDGDINQALKVITRI